MTLSLLLLRFAAVAAVAFGLSAMTGLALLAGARLMERLAPAARARLYLAATLLPAGGTAVLMVAALASSFGWLVDHCEPSEAPHAHPHICSAHHVAAIPNVLLTTLAGLLFLRLAFALARVVGASWHARRLRGATVAHTPDLPPTARVLELDAPQAFLVGALRPLLVVTRGLLDETHRAELDVVLAHERAHLARRDPLRTLLAHLALSFHLPGLARHLANELAVAHEMAADELAARSVKCELRVADTLVKLARAHRAAGLLVTSFGASGLERRVQGLLARRRRLDAPRAASLWVAAAFMTVVVAFHGDEIHHGIELFLELLSG